MDATELVAGAEVDIPTLLHGYRTKKWTAKEVMQSYLDRIDRIDRNGPKLNSIIAIAETALDRAEELDAHLAATGELAGPLHGVPMVLKDNIDTIDMPTSYGSEAMAGFQTGRDATTVQRLRDAGALVFAKATLAEWATSWFSYASISGTTKNPCVLDHDPGGSSAGPGAAVGADLTVAGLGTDCGGSVRIPSSFCNLVGFRSTPGVVPRYGSSALLSVQDTVGPMTKSVLDSALILDVIKGYTPDDAASIAACVAAGYGSFVSNVDPQGLAGARLGLLTSALGSDEDPLCKAVNDVIRAAVKAIEGAGGTVVEVEIENLTDYIVDTSFYLDESLRDLNRFLAEFDDPPIKKIQEAIETGRYDKHLDLLEGIAQGSETPEEDPAYLARVYRRWDFQRAVCDLFGRHRLDGLILPDCQVPSPPAATMHEIVTLEFPANTLIASYTCLPAITVPAGFTDESLPVGLEFVGLPYTDARLMRLAAGFERATRARRPAALLASAGSAG